MIVLRIESGSDQYVGATERLRAIVGRPFPVDSAILLAELAGPADLAGWEYEIKICKSEWPD